MTFPLALLLFGILMIYCGVKGKSLQQAIIGHSVDASSSSLLGGSSGSPSSSSSASSSSGGTAQPAAGSSSTGGRQIAPNTGG